MRKFIVVLLVILCASMVLAQSAPKVEVFGGYQYANVDTKGLTDRLNFNGWDADVAARISKNLSIVGDFSGTYHTESAVTGPILFGTRSADARPQATVTSVDVKLRIYNYLFGPRVSFGTGKISPFAEALFGLSRLSGAVSATGLPEVSTSSNGFGMALGGGLDYNANKRFAVRLVKFDYMLTRISNTDLGITSTESLNNYRIATGVVFKF